MDENNNNSTEQSYDNSGMPSETKAPADNANMEEIYPQQNSVPYGQPPLNTGSSVNQSGSYTNPQAGYYQNGSTQGGYGQNGYQQQGGYQQNGGYQQGGYQQQGGFMQNGYPQNGAYQQGGYSSYNQQYGGYQDPYYGYGQKPSQALAVTSLVCGIVSLLTGILGFALPILFLVPVVGLVTGIMHKLKSLPVGKGMSTAGIVLSIIGFVLPFVLILILIANLPAMLEYVKEVNPDAYQEFYDQYYDQMPQMFSAAFTCVKNIFSRL